MGVLASIYKVLLISTALGAAQCNCHNCQALNATHCGITATAGDFSWKADSYPLIEFKLSTFF
jgi:hypothetical protein